MQALDGADEDGGTLYVLRDQEGGFISSAVDAARAAGPPARSEVESLPSVMGLDNERSTMNEETNGQVDWPMAKCVSERRTTDPPAKVRG